MATGLSPVVNYLSQSIIVHSINCSLLDAETRCRQAMLQAADRRQRLISELAMRCPPLTVYGPASTAAGDGLDDDHQDVWNHTRTRPFDAVDVVSPTEAGRLTDTQVQLIGDFTIDNGTPPDKLMNMLRETAKRYVYRELDLLSVDIVCGLFDVLTARQCILCSFRRVQVFYLFIYYKNRTRGTWYFKFYFISY